MILGSPKFRATDSSGKPLSGGLVTVYEASAPTVKLATYTSDSELNSNPMVLDSRGEAFFNVTENCKIVLADSVGSTIWTVNSYQDSPISGYQDSNNVDILLSSATSSAVNYLTLSNSATGSNPTLSVSGTDVNASMSFQAGVYRVLGTSSGSAAIKLFEDRDSGQKYIAIKAATSISSSVTYTLPSLPTVSSKITTNGSGTLSTSARGEPIYSYTIGSSSSAISYSVYVEGIPYIDNIAQDDEGVELSVLTCSVSPRSSTNTLEISGVIQIAHNEYIDTSFPFAVALFRSDEDNSLATFFTYTMSSGFSTTNPRQYAIPFRFIYTAGTTNEITFTVRASACQGGPLQYYQYLNSTNAGRKGGGVVASYINIMEYET